MISMMACSFTNWLHSESPVIAAFATLASALAAWYSARKSTRCAEEANKIAKQSRNVPYATLMCNILNTERLESITGIIQEIHDHAKNDWAVQGCSDSATACRLDVYLDKDSRGGIIKSSLVEVNMLCHLLLEEDIPELFLKCIKTKIDVFLSNVVVRQYVEAHSSYLENLLNVYKTTAKDLLKCDNT